MDVGTQTDVNGVGGMDSCSTDAGTQTKSSIVPELKKIDELLGKCSSTVLTSD